MRAGIQGLEKLYKKLDRLSKAGGRRALRKAVRAGTNVLLKAVKAATPVDEGVLKRMQTSAVKGRGLGLWGRVGADVAKLTENAETGVRPTNIDWLVENGHVMPDGTVVPPTGFMRKAEASAMPTAEKTVADRLAMEIERELAG